MKQVTIKIIALTLLLTTSCLDSDNYRTYKLNESKINMLEPSNLRNATYQEIEKFQKSGNASLNSLNIVNTGTEKVLFFFNSNKDEFGYLKGVVYNLSDSEIENYYEKLKEMRKISFYSVQKTVSPDMSLDTLSRIQNINGTKFYVFETNIAFRDSLDQQFNLKTIKYNTLIRKTNFMIDASFIIKTDEEAILNSIKSIRIKN